MRTLFVFVFANCEGRLCYVYPPLACIFLPLLCEGRGAPRGIVQRGRVRPEICQARTHEREAAVAHVRVRGVEHGRHQAVQLAGPRPRKADGGEPLENRRILLYSQRT